MIPDIDDFAGCGSYEWHVVENRVLWSRGMYALFGIAEAPKGDLGVTELVHPDDRTRVEAETSGYLEKGLTYRHEFRILLPDGTVRHLHDRGEIERDANGVALIMRGLCFDVTEQRVAQEDTLTARMDDVKGVGFYEFDVARGSAWWSSEMFRLLDHPHAERVNPDDVTRYRIHPEDRDRLRALQNLVNRRLGPYDIEYRVQLDNGGIRWLRDRGEALGPINPATGLVWHVRGTVSDITELKTLSPCTPAGAETLRQVIERAPWGICIIDADFRLIQISDVAAEIFRPAAPLIGRDHAELLRLIWPEPFATTAIARFRHTLETGEPYHAPATRERRADSGLTEVYEWKLEQIRLPDGRAGLACYFYDLTDRVSQETALRESEERLKLAYEVAGMGAWDLDLITGESVWTPELYSLLGVDPDKPASAELFFQHVHPEDSRALRAAFDRSFRTGKIFDASFRVIRADGALRHLAARGRIVRRQAGAPVRMIGVNYDVTDRRRLERQIRDSEQELRLILDNAVAFIGLLTPAGELIEANATALVSGGLSRRDVIGKPFWETAWWTHDPAVSARLRDALRTVREGEAVRYDAVVRMQNDTRMTIDVLLSPIFDSDGRVARIVASAFDVTDREKAMERIELLMLEINHRSKNILALVQAIARQIWRTDRENFFDRFASRLQALSASQDLLVRNQIDGACLEDLARSQLAHFSELLDVRIHMRGPPLSVDPEAAQAIGMAFHELATNAGKYGALSTETGQVFIEWSSRDGRLELSWIEQGGPPVQPPSRSGFGTIVLDTLVRMSLSGDVQYDYAPDGLRWFLSCPARPPVA
ncbi:MAG: PAS domain-containing protein [Rhodobacterales bacterium]|nr:PAS domain-containing protein [Rhodobacterales bacterium]